MKKIIILIGEILLGCFIFFLIFGDTGSLKEQSTNLFNSAVTNLKTLK